MVKKPATPSTEELLSRLVAKESNIPVRAARRQVAVVAAEVAKEYTRRGRKPATGRYATRAELVAAVRADYRASGAGRTIPIIARNAGVSAAVVHKILDSGEGLPSRPEGADHG